MVIITLFVTGACLPWLCLATRLPPGIGAKGGTEDVWPCICLAPAFVSFLTGVATLLLKLVDIRPAGGRSQSKGAPAMSPRSWAMTGLALLLQWAVALPVLSAPVDDTYIRKQESTLRESVSRFFGDGTFNKSYALVIGVGDYDAANHLDAPPKDALRVRDFLRDKADFDYIVTLTDAAATQARIVKLMETTFPSVLHENDRFLFYFSGHGLSRAFPSGPRGYLLLKASHKDNFDEMIGMPDLSRWAENVSVARHVLFLLDSCSSGLAAVESKSAERQSKTIRSLAQPSSYLMTAGVDDEQSYAVKGASLFTEAFLEIAGGEFNPPQDGIVELDDIMSGIRRLLPLYLSQLGPGLKMTPHLSQFPRLHGNPGEFFFLVKNQRPGPEAPQQALAPVTPKAESSRTGYNAGEPSVQLPKSAQRTRAAGAHLSGLKGRSVAPVTPEPLPAPQEGPTPAPAPQMLVELAASSEEPKEFQDCKDCPAMVPIAPGTFQMGSDDVVNESPAHTVKIGYSFAVSKFPITRGQWRQYLTDSGRSSSNNCSGWAIGSVSFEPRRQYTWLNPGFDQEDDHPVVCVLWQEAKAYAAWLSQKTSHDYRLLSEAEYEYVTRAGSAKSYAWGPSSDEQCAYANGADTSARWWPLAASCHDGYVFTSPVGKFRANAFGLYDTVGNVWSWTEDCLISYKDAPGDGSASGSGDCRQRVVRGGCWSSAPDQLRSAYRSASGHSGANLGFRLARVH